MPSARVQDTVAELRRLSDPDVVEGRARFGINPKRSLGVSMPMLRAMAKRLGRDQKFAEGLWATGIHDARLLAAFTGEPQVITSATMDRWTQQFDTWDICDACCGSLFDKTRFAYAKPWQWAESEREFVRRAAFSMIAWLTVHDKRAGDEQFLEYLPLIRQYASDNRNFVKKAIDWALRNIGKRNEALREAALETAYEIRREEDTPGGRWVSRVAIRELESDAVRLRVAGR